MLQRDLFAALLCRPRNHWIGISGRCGSACHSATPYQVTVSPIPAIRHWSIWASSYAATGVPLVLHATPTTGQYSVDTATGVYTFAAADTLLEVFISYSYTNTAGNTMTVGNHAMGYGPIISMNVIFPYEGVSGGGIGFEFPLARLGKSTWRRSWTTT